MPSGFTSGQRAGLLLQVQRSCRARVFAGTAASYAKMVARFFAFCDDMGFQRAFTHDAIIAFAQHYVAGFGGEKIRSHGTVAKFMSAWADYASDNGLPFPFTGTAARRRIDRGLKGIANRFPHKPLQDHPVTLYFLAKLAPLYGFSDFVDLWTRPTTDLCRWARIIVAHDACMRPCEHSKGCRVGDINDRGIHVAIRVGSRRGEAKIKRTADTGGRIAVLPSGKPSHLAAAHVLRAVFKRVHVQHGSNADRTLLPAGAIGHDVRSAQRQWRPWTGKGGDLAFFRSCCARIGVPGALTITGRALRAGGATDWFAADATEKWVKAQGGWSERSTAHLIYNRPTEEQRAVMARHYNATITDHANAMAVFPQQEDAQA